MKHFLTVILFVALMVQSALAQDERNETHQPLVTFIKVDGRPCVASNAEEFKTLTNMVKMVNELRRKKAEGSIDETEYSSRVSAMLKEAELKGVRVN